METNNFQDIKKWILKADHDLGTSVLLAQKPIYKDVIVYHCQQAVEKYLKAYIIHFNLRFSKVHNLIILIDTIYDHSDFLEPFRNELDWLNTISNHVRYPDDKNIFDELNIKRAISLAKSIRENISLAIKIVDFEGDIE